MCRTVRQRWLLQLRPNRFERAFEVFENLIVPKAQHAITALLKIPCPLGVMGDGGFFTMPVTVKFNNQARLNTNKVNDIGAFRNLSLEFPAAELAIT